MKSALTGADREVPLGEKRRQRIQPRKGRKEISIPIGGNMFERVCLERSLVCV